MILVTGLNTHTGYSDSWHGVRRRTRDAAGMFEYPAGKETTNRLLAIFSSLRLQTRKNGNG
jgi:hypothetical protein